MVAKTQAAPAKAKFLVVQNLTGDTQAIVPDEADRRGQEIIVAPWDSITVRNYSGWPDDQNLALAVERGFVHVGYTDQKPRRMPGTMSDSLQSPFERAICADLVYGSQDRFDYLIAEEMDPKERRKEFIDYFTERYPVILKAALVWLKAWGPPEALVPRVALIEARLNAKKK